MHLRRFIYIILLAFVLTACGKAEDVKKEDNKLEQEDSLADSESKDDGETEEASQDTDKLSEDTSKEPSNNEKESASATEDSSKNSNNASNQKVESSTNNSNQNSSQKPAQNSGQNSNNSSQNTNQKPSTGSNTTTQTPTRKPVKRVSEEVKSAEVAYKYGVTKYDVTTNYYTLYSDDSRELIDSSSHTVYNSSNYSATDSQLKGEADSNASKYMSYYQEVLRLVNEIRASVGVAPLTLDTTLCKAASMRALEMDYSNQMSHTRPSGKDCFSVLDFYEISFGTCGENIAAGQTSASSVVKGWKNSPGHYQNMINASFTKLGVGYSASGVGDYGYYWCQLFTN